MISIKLQDKAFGVPALAGILKVVIPDDDPEKLRQRRLIQRIGISKLRVACDLRAQRRICFLRSENANY